jgi:hypothetical protein
VYLHVKFVNSFKLIDVRGREFCGIGHYIGMKGAVLLSLALCLLNLLMKESLLGFEILKSIITQN